MKIKKKDEKTGAGGGLSGFGGDKGEPRGVSAVEVPDAAPANRV